MKVVSSAAVVSAAILAASVGTAAAEGDAYCDYVEGVASAESALLLSPELFGTFGYIDQPIGAAPEATSNDLRVTAGVQVRLGSMYQGLLTRRRAKADCQRSRALDQVDREDAQAGERDHGLLEILRMGGAVNAGLGNRANIEPALGFANGNGVRTGTLADLALHRGRNVVNGVANGRNHLRIGGLQPGANLRRG